MTRPFLLLAATVLASVACVSPAHQGAGLLRTSVRGPLWVGGHPLPAAPVRGESRAYSFLGLFAWGDATVSAAMAAGGIGELHHADYEYESLLGVLSVYRVLAVGARAANASQEGDP